MPYTNCPVSKISRQNRAQINTARSHSGQTSKRKRTAQPQQYFLPIFFFLLKMDAGFTCSVYEIRNVRNGSLLGMQPLPRYFARSRDDIIHVAVLFHILRCCQTQKSNRIPKSEVTEYNSLVTRETKHATHVDKKEKKKKKEMQNERASSSCCRFPDLESRPRPITRAGISGHEIKPGVVEPQSLSFPFSEHSMTPPSSQDPRK